MVELLKEIFSGVIHLFSVAGIKNIIMFFISFVLIYLAIKRV